MGTLTPGQMYTNMLNPVKGWPSQAALDKSAPVDTVVETDLSLMKAGAICCLSSTGGFIRGVTSRAMPIFLFQNANDFDANSDKYNTSGGKVSGLVATGSYELQTTEYSAGTYTYNTLLKADTAGNVGKVVDTAIAQVTVDVVGICSGPVVTNAYGKQVLTFWPTYLPKV